MRIRFYGGPAHGREFERNSTDARTDLVHVEPQDATFVAAGEPLEPISRRMKSHIYSQINRSPLYAHNCRSSRCDWPDIPGTHIATGLSDEPDTYELHIWLSRWVAANPRRPKTP